MLTWVDFLGWTHYGSLRLTCSSKGSLGLKRADVSLGLSFFFDSGSTSLIRAQFFRVANFVCCTHWVSLRLAGVHQSSCTKKTIELRTPRWNSTWDVNYIESSRKCRLKIVRGRGSTLFKSFLISLRQLNIWVVQKWSVNYSTIS